MCVVSIIKGGETNQALYNLFAAYFHTVPLSELIASVERAQHDAQLRHVVLTGAACSYCLGRDKWLEGSHLRKFALELKEVVARSLAVCVTPILLQHRGKSPSVREQTSLNEVKEVLCQVMCAHDAEKLAMSVLEMTSGSS